MRDSGILISHLARLADSPTKTLGGIDVLTLIVIPRAIVGDPRRHVRRINAISSPQNSFYVLNVTARIITNDTRYQCLIQLKANGFWAFVPFASA
jgi:hypothetical protein